MWWFQISFYLKAYLGKISNLTNIFKWVGLTTNSYMIMIAKFADKLMSPPNICHTPPTATPWGPRYFFTGLTMWCFDPWMCPKTQGARNVKDVYRETCDVSMILHLKRFSSDRLIRQYWWFHMYSMAFSIKVTRKYWWFHGIQYFCNFLCHSRMKFHFQMLGSESASFICGLRSTSIP